MSEFHLKNTYAEVLSGMNIVVRASHDIRDVHDGKITDEILRQRYQEVAKKLRAASARILEACVEQLPLFEGLGENPIAVSLHLQPRAQAELEFEPEVAA